MTSELIPVGELCPGLWDGEDGCPHGYFWDGCFPHRESADPSDESVFPLDFGGGPGQHDSFVIHEMFEAWSAYGREEKHA